MGKELLYYNPNVVTHPRNNGLPGIEKFSYFFKIFNATVVFIDRTGTIKTPVTAKPIFPIPAFRPISKTFEEICNDRARELLLRADALQVTLYVFWSGGIDSTLLLVSLLKNATIEQKARIVVLLTEDSIKENPRFYREHIHGKLKVDSSTMFPYLLGTKHMILGGEHNDQLFGSNMVNQLILRFGASSIHKPYSRDTFFTLFNEKLHNPDITNFYLDLFERLREAAPIDITSNFDYLWWINFTVKWQGVFMRILSYTTPRNSPNVDIDYIQSRYFHFYETDDFQLWSLNNQDKKIKDSWSTYKWVCKDIIYDYTKDADYRDNKTKIGSLYFLLLQQSPYDFIDASGKLLAQMDPKDYYNPNNDFV